MDLNLGEWNRRLKVVRRSPSRVVDVLREPRPIVIGGRVANLMGLQVARTCKDRAAWALRGDRTNAAIRSAMADMDRDGIVVIEDFLPRETWEQVKEEFERSRVDPKRYGYRYQPFGENFGVDDALLTDHPHLYPQTLSTFRDNEFIQSIACAVARRRPSYKPHVSFFHVHKPDPKAPFTDNDYNQFLHSDRHYPFVKAFFYLCDVDETNAPYTYARGSHKLSMARLRYEYEYSKRYVAVRGARYVRTTDQLERDRALSALADSFLDEIGTKAEPITGRANTLIISNNQGFHKRGAMPGIKPRSTLNIDFKYLESPAQWMYPLLRHLYREG